jgi:hypothetical protein
VAEAYHKEEEQTTVTFSPTVYSVALGNIETPGDTIALRHTHADREDLKGVLTIMQAARLGLNRSNLMAVGINRVQQVAAAICMGSCLTGTWEFMIFLQRREIVGHQTP